MPAQVLFENGEHRNILMEDFSSGQMVQANQHVILHRGRGILLDPGGHKVYSMLLAELGAVMATGNLDYLFFSHQDPDIVAAANGWMMMTNARALIPRVWVRFVAHFGVDDAFGDRIMPIPDKGMRLDLGGSELILLPAHFMHSPGNFQIYDPVSKILYSGDLGASLGQTYTMVQNFDDHIQYMKGFHQRYMPSGAVLKKWAAMVRTLDIQTIAPQHGAMMKGPEIVKQFISWIETLPCGIDLIGGAYQLP
jgi:flavorubredoxin